jgi:hypothetical protein
MYASANPVEEPSPREALAMRLLLLRRPGNRFPDNDRDVSGSSATRRETIVCY